MSKDGWDSWSDSDDGEPWLDLSTVPPDPPPSIVPENRPHSDLWSHSDDGVHWTDFLSPDTSLPLGVEYQPHSAAKDDSNDDISCTNFLSADTSPPITEEHRPRSITAADESNSTANVFYELKKVDFLYSETPIILQDKNGPCPLIAICNVLLLRGEMDLGPVGSKVRHDDLIERLADLIVKRCNNVEGKDESLRKRQMIDALDILPRLGVGLNVNLRFRKIDDFEATPGCAIFDVLGIGFYHGWIVDPEEASTVAAIGTKSYDTLAVDIIDVPSPRFSGNRSDSAVVEQVQVKCVGDSEEETELARGLNLSRTNTSSSVNVRVTSDVDWSSFTSISEKNDDTTRPGSLFSSKPLVAQIRYDYEKSHLPDVFESQDHITSSFLKSFPTVNGSISHGFTAANVTIGPVSKGFEEPHQLEVSQDSQPQEHNEGSEEVLTASVKSDMPMQYQAVLCQPVGVDGSNGWNTCKDQIVYAGEEESVTQTSSEYSFWSQIHHKDMDRKEHPETTEVFTSCLEVTEPINEDQPVCEGQLIKQFLQNNASQLTTYGLFCLKEGLKEMELCVLFRNNHFSTMFKFNGELYLLLTDQGFIDQTDFVWEKLTGIRGEAVFMNGNFSESVAESIEDSQNERSAIPNSADYMATDEDSSLSNPTMKSDFNLAIELQKQEYDQMSSTTHALSNLTMDTE